MAAGIPYPIRVHPADLAAIDFLANHWNTSKQEAIRRAVREAVQRETDTTAPGETDGGALR